MTELDTHTLMHQWSLATIFGYQHPFFIVHTKTVVSTWIMLCIIICMATLCRILLFYPGYARTFVLALITPLIDMTKQALAIFSFNHFSFIAALFIFITLANTLSIIPGLHEPTNDINTTLALGIITFIYTQHAAIVHTGLKKYIQSYFSPIFFMFPLAIIGKLSSIISLSFRLFGNIAGGAIIVDMYLTHLIRTGITTELIGIGTVGVCISFIISMYKRASFAISLQAALLALFFSPNMLMTLFFGVFEGFLQAFVFTMLSLTYLASAIQGEGH